MMLLLKANPSHHGGLFLMTFEGIMYTDADFPNRCLDYLENMFVGDYLTKNKNNFNTFLYKHTVASNGIPLCHLFSFLLRVQGNKPCEVSVLLNQLSETFSNIQYKIQRSKRWVTECEEGTFVSSVGRK